MIDATQVMGSLPTKAEIDVMLRQNSQLVQLLHAEQSRAAELNKPSRMQQLARKRRNGDIAQTRLEAALDIASKTPERFLSELEREFHASGVLSTRDIVQIYVPHDEEQFFGLQ